MRHVTNSLIVLALITIPCAAFPIQVLHFDIPMMCDPLAVPLDVDELGSIIVPFPQDEQIDHRVLSAAPPVCGMDDPSLANPVVEILNLTGRDFQEVWYVADTETSISNFDGYVEDVLLPSTPPRHLSFRIDNAVSDPLGTHHPLLFESGTPDGIFEAGEAWQFVLQDYFNGLGLPADAFTSFHVGAASMNLAGLLESSGSIIAIPVPEPTSFVLLGLAAVSLVTSRIRNQP